MWFNQFFFALPHLIKDGDVNLADIQVTPIEVVDNASRRGDKYVDSCS